MLSDVDWLERAEAIVNSDAVISVFAACEWDELSEDGQCWLAAIVRQAFTMADAERDAIRQ